MPVSSYSASRCSPSSETPPTAVLIDGIISAGWTIEVKKSDAVLAIEPYHKISKRDVRDTEAEGLAFLKFMRPDAKSFDVRVQSQP